MTIDGVDEGTTIVNWYVGEDNNQLENKQKGMEVVCTLDGHFFD